MHKNKHIARYGRQVGGLFLFILLPWFSNRGYAQGALDLEVSGDYNATTLIEVLLDLEQRYPPLKFYYDPNILPYYKVTYKISNKPLFNVMQFVLPQNGLTCTTSGQYGVVVLRKSDMNREYITGLLDRWNKGQVALPEFLQPYALTARIGSPPATEGQVAVVLDLHDDQTREGMAGVSAKVLTADSVGYNGSKGGTSNAQGKLSLRLPTGTHQIQINYPGYRELTLTLQVYQNGEAEIAMQQRLQNLQEVVIQGNKAADKVNSTTSGIEALSTQRIKEIPTLMGEADVVKSLSTLAGISTVGDGAAGFNVRGGNIDQNLIQQDGLVLYNTSHVLGFFSTFNSDVVGNTTLYKGHIPAQFGGRISSVLDVQTKSPNMQQWRGAVGLGLTNARVMTEGPLVKNRIALVLGARRSYSDWLLKTAKLPDVKQSSAWFGDATTKLSILLPRDGSFEIGGHYSSDFFRFAREFGYAWDTRGATATYRQLLTRSLFLSVNYSVGQTSNTYFTPDGTEAFNLTTRMVNQRARAQVTWTGLDKHELKTGTEWSRMATQPQTIGPRGSQSSYSERAVAQDKGEDWSFFAEDEWKISTRLTANIGLRYTAYRQIGAGQSFEYEPGAALTPQAIADTVEWADGATMQRYGGFEPRVALNVKLDEGQSIKLSYNRLRQYVHLISNTTAATPADLWQVSTKYIPPQTGDNFSLGYYRNLNRRIWETSGEVFYKAVTGMPAYRDFAELLLNEHIETELVTGRSWSYGFEYSLRKKEGKLTGSLAYTLSRVWQQAKSDEFPEISVNKGAWFPANFDQPHQVNLFLKYGRNPSRYWTANFTYRSGRPVSAPRNGYQVGSTVVPYFPQRNNLRIPDYHRLDIGFTIDRTKSTLQGRGWMLTFSVFNVYGRQNPFAVYFKRDARGIPKSYQLSAIGTAIPSVNYSYTF